MTNTTDMKCKKCGAEISDDSRYCEQCGTQLRKSLPTGWLVAIVAVCSMAAGLVLGMFLPIHGSGASSQPTADEGWVDLGLPSGNLWANCNVGASQPDEKGDFYAWGETAKKSSYAWNNYAHGKAEKRLTKYCTRSAYGRNGFVDKMVQLQPADDIATQNDSCAVLPTKADWEELIDHTRAEWTKLNGVSGMRLTAENGNSIFLPAAGSSANKENSLFGFYWSSTLIEDCPSDAFEFCFRYYKDAQGQVATFVKNEKRFYGFSIRPVRHCKL